MFTVEEIATYFLSLSDPASGDGLSHLKLQKLCYYAQGFHLARFGEPLFMDTLQAWQHGPVSPVLYNVYSSQRYNFIVPSSINIEDYPLNIRKFLDEIYDVYGQFSAWKLRDMTHEELPWREASCKPDNTISLDTMRNYFKNLLI